MGTQKRLLSYTIEMDKDLAELLDDKVVTMSQLSTLEVAVNLKERMVANLSEHQSENTGTALARSARAKEVRERYGPTLSEQVNIRKEDDGYSVGLAVHVQWIGRFLEYGNDQVFWGNKTGGTDEPKPWMRPAADALQDRAADLAAKKFREENRRG